MARASSKRIYYHETRDVCDGLPDLLFRFALRALLVARPGERVVLPEGFEPTELPLLNRLGFGPRPEDIIYIRQDGSVASGDADLAGAAIFPFSGTSERLQRFCDRHAASVHGPSRALALLANSKATFQKIVNAAFDQGFGRLGPAGAIADLADAGVLAQRLADRYGKVIIKGVHSASGLQQVTVERGETPVLDGLPDKVVVQEWVPHEYASSLQCYVEPDGRVRELSTTVQILQGNHHIGNRCPSGLPDAVVRKMSRIVRLVGATLAERAGFWGICGIDFLVREHDAVVLANEVNARIPAPWYPWNASRRAFGEPLPFRMKSIALDPGTAIGDVAAAMGPLLFDNRTRQGFVPFCFVPEHGFVYGATFAPDVTTLDAIVPGIDERLAELAPKI